MGASCLNPCRPTGRLIFGCATPQQSTRHRYANVERLRPVASQSRTVGLCSWKCPLSLLQVGVASVPAAGKRLAAGLAIEGRSGTDGKKASDGCGMECGLIGSGMGRLGLLCGGVPQLSFGIFVNRDYRGAPSFHHSLALSSAYARTTIFSVSGGCVMLLCLPSICREPVGCNGRLLRSRDTADTTCRPNLLLRRYILMVFWRGQEISARERGEQVMVDGRLLTRDARHCSKGPSCERWPDRGGKPVVL